MESFCLDPVCLIGVSKGDPLGAGEQFHDDIEKLTEGFASFVHCAALGWSPFGHGSDGHEV